MTKEQIINNLELYTFGRPKKAQVFITVEKLQNLIDEIKALDQETNDCKIFGTKENCFGGATEYECNHCDYKIQKLEQQPSEDTVTITMKKGILKYSDKGYVVYNKDWFRKHFATEVKIMTGYDGYIEQETKRMQVLPDNATNGDIIKSMLNPYKVCEYEYSVHVYMTEEDFWKSDYQMNCNARWWNAPYK